MNLNPKINPKWIAAILGVAALGVGAKYGGNYLRIGARADAEVRQEEPEITECKRRLTLFYGAWKQYAADHNGQDPPSVQAMIPKYIKDPDLLLCPTQKRMDALKIHLNVGKTTVAGKDYEVSYGFKWLTAGYARFLKKEGDKIPLIVCTSHRAATYAVAYKSVPQSLDFSSPGSKHVVSAVGDMPILAVRHNGKIDQILASEQ